MSERGFVRARGLGDVGARGPRGGQATGPWTRTPTTSPEERERLARRNVELLVSRGVPRADAEKIVRGGLGEANNAEIPEPRPCPRCGAETAPPLRVLCREHLPPPGAV